MSPQKNFNLSQWLVYIESLHCKEIDLGLDRISLVANKNQLTQLQCPVITVAGTNGKGSCIHCLESIYREAGYQVGSYTSPHLLRFNERIRLDGGEVDDATLMEAFEVIERCRGDVPLSFFEFTTLTALYCFKQIKLDLVLLEVGLGGRLDAVNIVDADCSVITCIDLDHQDWLGETREQIAYEKAGIIAKGSIAICGDPNPPATIAEQALTRASAFHQIKKNYNYLSVEGGWSFLGGADSYEQLPPVGIKRQNAATSLMAVESLQQRLPVSEQAIRNGLAALKIPGRFERLVSPVSCWLDVAHNPQATGWLAQQLKNLNLDQQFCAVFAMLSTKDVAESVKPLLPLIDSWFVADLNVPRGQKAEKLSSILAVQGAKNCYNFTDVRQAFIAACQTARIAEVESGTHHSSRLQGKPLLVFGSFHTVAAVKEYINPDNCSG